MAITLFNPRTKAFFSYTPPDDGNLPLDQVISLNILIELRVISEFLESESGDSADDLRTDIVSST